MDLMNYALCKDFYSPAIGLAGLIAAYKVIDRRYQASIFPFSLKRRQQVVANFLAGLFIGLGLLLARRSNDGFRLFIGRNTSHNRGIWSNRRGDA